MKKDATHVIVAKDPDVKKKKPTCGILSTEYPDDWLSIWLLGWPLPSSAGPAYG